VKIVIGFFRSSDCLTLVQLCLTLCLKMKTTPATDLFLCQERKALSRPRLPRTRDQLAVFALDKAYEQRTYSDDLVHH
jgi:hypothetical protein